MKFLLWGLVIYVAWRWYQASQIQPEIHADSKARDKTTSSDEVEKMVSCVHCGIHVPLSEAVPAAHGLFFCSMEHQKKHTL